MPSEQMENGSLWHDCELASVSASVIGVARFFVVYAVVSNAAERHAVKIAVGSALANDVRVHAKNGLGSVGVQVIGAYLPVARETCV